MSEPIKYTEPELLACTASHILENKKSVFVGTGLPMIATMLAQKTHAPELLIIFEAGGLGPQMPVLPISVGDSRTFHRAMAASSMHDVMSLSQGGYVDFGFLGAAQIDPYGNINTTMIGPYEDHKTRLPGSGGANDVGSFSQRTIVIMRQDKRKFVEKVDFITTPGFLTGPGAREEAGLPKNTGPYRVITQLGVYGFHPQTKRMMLLSLHQGVKIEDAKANASFQFEVADKIEVTRPPTEREIKILHQEIDPVGIVLRK